MLRRDFLKLVGLSTAAAAVALAVPIASISAASKTVSSGGRLYRCDGSSRISVSADGGQSWAVHTDLGTGYAVSRLTVDRSDRLIATVGYRAWSFKLLLAPNLTTWMTA